MVKAYQVLAERQGCRIIRSIATYLKKVGDIWQLSLHGGKNLRARKVVLCQGTYTKVASLTRGLLPPMDLSLTAQTLALIEVSPEENKRLASMPSMVEQVNI